MSLSTGHDHRPFSVQSRDSEVLGVGVQQPPITQKTINLSMLKTISDTQGRRSRLLLLVRHLLTYRNGT